jgi:drug/metabolite transporter (DMT)-like permease
MDPLARRSHSSAGEFGYSVIFLRERPTRRAILGLLFAVAGVFLVVFVV